MPDHSTPLRPLIDSKIRKAILRLHAWYRIHQRPLPWRLRPNPYRIAVSEFMCQQTRITTVLPYYHRWLRRFPTWSALARAPLSVVLRQWEGLGYYRRARFLHQLARAVLRRPDRALPASFEELQRLPGIGDYTAGAIASIAFSIPVPAFDGNVARVLGRLFARRHRVPSTPQLHSLATALVPQLHPGLHNQALMELGALVCLPKNPLCPQCPLRSACPSQIKLPHRTSSRPKPILLREVLFLIRRRSSVWLTRQHPANRWRGLFLLPTNHKIPAGAQPLKTLVYTYTKYRITARVISLTRPPPQLSGRWFTPAQLQRATLPAPHRRALQLF